MTYLPITILCISFMFIEIKFIHCHSCVMFVLGSEVDKPSKILIKHQMQWNKLNWVFKTLRHQEHMIMSSSVYEKIYFQVPLKESLKLFKCLSSSGIYTSSGWLDLLFKALHQERKRRNERILTRLAWAPRAVVILHLFIDIWYVYFS